MKQKGLTPQQEAFAREVASGKSQAEAYRVAYPRSRRWKPEAVWAQASQLAADRRVSLRVAELQAAAADQAVLEGAEILAELRRVALSDIAGIMTDDGRVKLPSELDAATRAAVASFEIDEFGRIKYRFWDKNTALTNALKVLGKFEKDNRQKADPVLALLQSLTGNVIGPAGSERAINEDGDGE